MIKYFAKGLVFVTLSVLFTPITFAQQFDVLWYGIHLKATNPAGGTVEGYTDVLVKSETAGLSSLKLELYQLQVDSVWQGGMLRPHTYVNDTLTITLDPLALGEEDTLRIFYQGTPKQDPQGFGGYYKGTDYAFCIGLSGSGQLNGRISFGACWFPCVDNFTEKARFDFYITTNTTYRVFCNGTQQGAPTLNGGEHTYHWKLRDPIPPYLANMAVGIFDGQSTTYSAALGTLPVDLYTIMNASRIAGTFVNLPQALSIYENRFGPYEWERLGYVFTHLPGFALENASNILMPLVTLSGNLLFENIVVHELAHSWFGNLITCEQPREMWFNEGFARWAESLYFEDKYGLATATNHLRSAHQKAINISEIEDGGFHALSNVPDEYVYGTATYEKGATVVQTLRHYLGDDVFFPALQAMFQSSRKFGNISSNEFRDFLATYSSRNLDAFFEGWVHQPGWVTFSLDSVPVTDNGDGTWNAQLHLRQTLYYKPGFIDENRLEVAFYDDEFHTHLDTITFSGQTATAVTQIPFVPEMVVLDPGGKCLDGTVGHLLKAKNTGTTMFSVAGASLQITAIQDSALFYIAHKYGQPTGLLDYDTLVLAGNYYEFQHILPDNITYRLNLDFYGNSSTDGKDRRWFGNTPEANIRLVYRPHTGANWEPVANVIRNTGGGSDLRGSLGVANNPPAGQYAFAIRTAGVGRQQARLMNDQLHLGPVPASDHLNVQWADLPVTRLHITDLGGRLLRSIPVQGSQVQILLEGLPSGVYLVQAHDRRGKALSAKRFVIAGR
ncbi:MAG: hypothetical protein KF690_06335 [Bacteroidetes bacterium]|nr:hypothetical protein [Bacteroidota bacterium]